MSAQMIGHPGCARFPEFLQKFTEPQILQSLCSVDFLTFTLKLPTQPLLSVAPKLPVYARSGEKCQKFSKTSTAPKCRQLLVMGRLTPNIFRL